MQLGKVEGRRRGFYDASTDDTTWEQENVWTMKGGKSCHTCGGKGHFARECPSKGEGKGQEGGWSKRGSKGGNQGIPRVPRAKNVFTKGRQKGGKYGKGGGKGPAGGCWTCGPVDKVTHLPNRRIMNKRDREEGLVRVFRSYANSELCDCN